MKKSKLAIQFFHGEDLKKIGKSLTGFPLYVIVRYKRAKVTYTSHFAVRLVRDNPYYLDQLRTDRSLLDRLIEKETNYISLFRDYIEEIVSVTFQPQMLTQHASLNTLFVESMLKYFNSLPLMYALETKLREKSSYAFDLLDQTPIMILLGFLKDTNSELFDELVEIGKCDTFFKAYEDYREALQSYPEDDINKLQFRMMKFEKASELNNFKTQFDQKFDAEARFRIAKG
ncbi:hypothetical protein KI659_00025 [Litoribacter alkaliphilus]|uniref:Uncharacterized protein n=1 Tax=Litoribacter ruber TaxID=702568 RepID=A0AAP2CGU7_9BACT|nr:hypothetical protein [Litoribacter alkaliphilus]MBS9522390.1 hypothetical protein [Litoribacter alkaliphilus]